MYLTSVRDKRFICTNILRGVKSDPSRVLFLLAKWTSVLILDNECQFSGSDFFKPNSRYLGYSRKIILPAKTFEMVKIHEWTVGTPFLASRTAKMLSLQKAVSITWSNLFPGKALAGADSRPPGKFSA